MFVLCRINLISFDVIRLLTPPGTPLSLHRKEVNQNQLQWLHEACSFLARSTSTTKVVFRISVSQPESYPSPRVRPPPQPVIPPDFPLDTPPNLRTTLQERPFLQVGPGQVFLQLRRGTQKPWAL